MYAMRIVRIYHIMREIRLVICMNLVEYYLIEIMIHIQRSLY